MPERPRPGIGGLLAVCLLAAACGPAALEPAGAGGRFRALVDVPQQLVFEGPVLVVPGPRWQEQDGRWRFRAFGRLLCVVREATGQPLRIRLRPDEATSEFDFRIAWNGADVDAGSLRRAPGLIEIEIAPERVTAGRHEILIQRQRRPQVPFQKMRHDNLFHDLRITSAERETVLAPAEAPRQRLLAEFLQHGVAGRDQERRGGVLFAAPGSVRLALADLVPEGRPGPARIRFEPESFSPRGARFRLRAGEIEAVAEVAAGERGEIALEVEAGAGELVLAVEDVGNGEDPGGEDRGGPYLWGLPIFEPLAGTDRPELAPIVLITLDTTRRDALGTYGGRPEVTPALDAFAAQATVFEQAFATAPWTLPSHASIFTGLYPSKHGAGVSDVQLPAGSATLAGLLRRRGYLTAGFSAGELSSSRFGLAQGFHQYRNPDEFETLGDRVTAYVEDFLDRFAAHPLFLFVNYFDPHAVYRAPAEFEERLGVAALAQEVRDLPVWGELIAGEMSAWRSAVEGEAPIDDAVRDYLKAAYLAEVAYTDRLVGSLFERLRELEVFDRALIVVTADHGELLGEGGYVSHAARLDPELMEIPLIVKWPGQEQGGRVDRLVSLVDLFPTVLEAAGLEPPASDGLSLAGAGDVSRRFVLLEEHEFLVHPLPRFMKVARHLFGVQQPEFRQLVWDRDQECARRRNGAWDPEPCSADRERVLRSIQAELQVEMPAGDGDPPAEEAVSDEMRESLEALGYL